MIGEFYVPLYSRQTGKGGDRGIGGSTTEEDIVDQALDRFKVDFHFLVRFNVDFHLLDRFKVYFHFLDRFMVNFHFHIKVILLSILCTFSSQANILFKQFELETTVDRVLVYITLYIVGTWTHS